MRLNDVWKRANEQIGFYTIDNFDKVPTSPGVYAWFYPLRVTTKNIDDFLNQVNVVLNYDSISLGKPIRTTHFNFSWEKIKLTAEFTRSFTNISSFSDSWASLCDSDKFDDFRRIIMKSSIFLPPLYVGKTSNLYNRCFQHINGDGTSNSFHSRFENYSGQIPHATAKFVSELLFVCISTEELVGHGEDAEGLIEAILKFLGKPKYSKL